MSSDIIDTEYEEYLPEKIKTSSMIPSIDDEYLRTRNSLVETLKVSQNVLKKAEQLVTEYEHPRAIEVFSGLIKSIADVNKTIFDIREKKMKIDEGVNIDANDNVGQQINNNALFVGSTSELFDMMQKNHKKEEEEKIEE